MTIEMIFSVIALCTILLSFYKLKYSVALYWLMLCLIPLDKIPLLGYSLSWTILTIFLLVIFLLRSKFAHDIRTVKPFLVLFTFYLLAIPFQTDTPYLFQLRAWGMDFCRIVIIPFLVWNLYKKDHSVLGLMLFTTLLCIGIVVLYSYVLLLLEGINPYIMLMIEISDEDPIKWSQYYLSDDRLFGRISSVFFHPMTFAYFLGLSFVFLLYFSNKINTVFKYILLSTISLMMLLCGVRSVLGGMLIATFFYLIRMRIFKYFVYAAILITIILIVLSFNDVVFHYITSIFDVSGKNDIRGSSISMRLDQLRGAFVEISDNPLLGKGYDWVNYYESTKGDHPVLLAFESIVFVVLCENGLLGIIAWCVFGMSIIKIIKTMQRRNCERILLATLFVYYISYSLITGEYGYMQYFSMFYMICIIKESGRTIIPNKIII